MSHKIKALILAAFATLAMSAVGVGFAQAEEEVDAVLKGGHTEGELTNTVLTGEQYGKPEHNFFQTAVGTTTCTNSGVDFAATVAKETNEYLTATANYQECETTDGSATTVNMNDCDYTFSSPDTTIEEGKRFTGEATLFCPHEKDIEISVFLFRSGHASHSFKVCTIKVGPNEGETHHELGGHVLYENVKGTGETDDHITMEVAVENIPYEGCGSERKTDGTYESTVTIKGFNDTSEPPTTEHEHGDEQLDVWLDEK